MIAQDQARDKERGADELVRQTAAWLRLLLEPGQVTELRALQVRRRAGGAHTEAGFFDYDHVDDMARLALEVSPFAKGVYFVMNPLKPDLVARRANRVDWAGEGELAGDAHVLRRRWLLIDADPVKDALVSSTDREKACVLEVIRAVREDLAARGWPAPILADSGNGYHLFYRIELPADDGGLIRNVLKALACRFNSDRVKVDEKVFNPARIVKVPGTMARKGDAVADRPHRRASILEVPA
jgi:hypothetical protein